jgi:hypothetical protein
MGVEPLRRNWRYAANLTLFSPASDLYSFKMAEVIGLASGLLTLIGFAYKSSKSLYDLLHDIQNCPKAIRQLRDELGDVGGVLQSLERTVSNEDDDFTTLKIPLQRCGDACREFQEIFTKFNSGNSKRAQLRDWVMVKYMGEEISGFKDVLAGYKSTICIAIGDANLYVSLGLKQIFHC